MTLVSKARRSVRSARISLAGGCAFLYAILAGPTAALADEVRLTGDRTLKGTVVSDDDDGVKIKLASGEVRTVPRAEVIRVEYDDEPTTQGAPTVARGPEKAATLLVQANASGQLIVDGEAKGAIEPAAPVKVTLAPGKHVVEVEFANGQREEETVSLRAGRQEVLELRDTSLVLLTRHQPGFGVSLGVGAGGLFVLDPRFNGIGGGSVHALANYAIAPQLDLRAGPELFFGANAASGDVAYAPTLVVDAKLHLSSLYAMSLGGQIGGTVGLSDAAIDSSGSIVSVTNDVFLLGLRASLLELHLGATRAIEISLPQSVFLAGPGFASTLQVSYFIH